VPTGFAIGERLNGEFNGNALTHIQSLPTKGFMPLARQQRDNNLNAVGNKLLTL
jgi:hypothetical protein